jgi:myo-inositol-1(or 4)-monophosphatase
MAVVSEQPTAPSKFPKVAAPTTGPIPADELLGVIQAAAKAGAEVRLRFCFSLVRLPLSGWFS